MPPLPVYRSPHWDQTEHDREQEVLMVAEQSGFEFKLASGFRESGGRHWAMQLIAHWELASMKQADLASLLGLTPGQISKFLSDGNNNSK